MWNLKMTVFCEQAAIRFSGIAVINSLNHASSISLFTLAPSLFSSDVYSDSSLE